MVVTRAGEALRAALDPTTQTAWSQSALARALGVKQPSVSEWVRMRARPESHLRKAIERLLGIPEVDWMTDDERRIAETGPELATGT
ncbi:MAG: hypothetical protein JWP97_5745 [Labilithrix sp.]|nr:hypothetical protein [Labilithrix sp.]